MTQLRKFRDSISNYFDEIERGIGKRGSTFTDIDACSHDLDTHRFLFREFKQPGEGLDKAQRWILRDLANLPGCTVWFLRRLDLDRIDFGHFGSGRRAEVINVFEYRRRLACWWANEDYRTVPIHDTPPDPTDTGRMLSAEEIFGR